LIRDPCPSRGAKITAMAKLEKLRSQRWLARDDFRSFTTA
jgi:hypothetical protein